MGDLAGAAVTTPILVVVYVIGAALASTVASGAIVFLGNELGSFDPWPRSRVRLWSAATVVSASLVGLFLAVKLFG